MHPKLSETFSHYKKIILVGWGTGWHIQPIVNTIDELSWEKDLVWIGGKNSEEEKTAKKHNIQFSPISTLKLSTTRSPKIFLYPFVLIQGILEARKIILSVMSTESSGSVKTTRHLAQKNITPEQDFSRCSTSLEMKETKHIQTPLCIFSKWWPGSVAIGVAAWTLGIPLYIHESDTIPGRSNRILGKIATKIFLWFKSAKKYFEAKKCEVVWQILHRVFSSKIHKKSAIEWKTDKPHILVICGSQWSKAVFEAIIEQFKKDNPYEWIVALGKLNTDMKSRFDAMLDTQVYEWISQEDIAYLLYDTDIAITRGSATTLAEIDTFGVRKIIIPLHYSADNHQYWNAKEYEKKWDILLEQKDIHKLKEIILSYVK